MFVYEISIPAEGITARHHTSCLVNLQKCFRNLHHNATPFHTRVRILDLLHLHVCIDICAHHIYVYCIYIFICVCVYICIWHTHIHTYMYVLYIICIFLFIYICLHVHSIPRRPRFTFIILMQRMKMVHQRKLEAARELYGLSPSDEVPEDELKMKAKVRRCWRPGDV